MGWVIVPQLLWRCCPFCCGVTHAPCHFTHRLFYAHPSSPGCVSFLPHGTRIFNKLVDLMRAELRVLRYEEVRTPMLYKQSLWETSGHWQNYREDMFSVTGAVAETPADTPLQSHAATTATSTGERIGLKPMNCPAHCVLYSASVSSFRDLPLRLADFGSLHRNEASGALGGLTRLRLFHQVSEGCAWRAVPVYGWCRGLPRSYLIPLLLLPLPSLPG
jgi:threonyl-tRNA synthetase